MIATARARFAALMNAIRGRVPVAPALPKPPPMPPQIDMRRRWNGLSACGRIWRL